AELAVDDVVGALADVRAQHDRLARVELSFLDQLAVEVLEPLGADLVEREVLGAGDVDADGVAALAHHLLERLDLLAEALLAAERDAVAEHGVVGDSIPRPEV